MGQSYYSLSKSSMRELLQCMMKHFLVHRFRYRIPHDRFSAVGSVLHHIVEIHFWEKNWESPDSFARFSKWCWTDLFGHLQEDERGRIQIIFSKQNPKIDGRPVVLRDPKKDFWWGHHRIGVCAFNYARRFIGERKPLLEKQATFHYDGLRVTCRLDALFRRGEIVGKRPWYIGETKTGEEPLDTDWEPAIEIMAWAHMIDDPKIAAHIEVPPEIASAIQRDRLEAFKYCGVVYFTLGREDPERVETYHHATPAQWVVEFSRAAHEQQDRALKAVGSGVILLNREHCRRCEAKKVCDDYLREKHSLVTKPQSLFDPGLLVSVSPTTKRQVDLYRLDFSGRSKKGVRKTAR